MKPNFINIFKFIEKTDDRPIPFKQKLLYNIPLTDADLNVKGDLDLSYTPIETLPDNLRVGGDLDLSNTPIARSKTSDEIRKMIEDTGGSIDGTIYL